MPNEYPTAANIRARKPSIFRAVCNFINVTATPESQPDEIVATKQSSVLVSVVRFFFLLAIYTFLLVTVLASLDAAQHGNSAPGINFAYKVF